MHPKILSDLVITRVRSASTMYTPQNKKLTKRDRPCWAIVLKYEGETVYTSGGRRFPSDLSHAVILPKGCSYDWVCTQAGHYSIIEFECDASMETPISLPVKNGEKLLRAFRDLEHKRDLRLPTVELESIRDTYSILLSLLQTEPAAYLAGGRREKIAPAVAYVSLHYTEPITNDALAALTGLSTVYFRKLFTEVMGVSPIVYVHRLRVEKAKEMLKSDYGTLSDVAQSLGYPSLYDFSRDFKKHAGVSPSHYAGRR